MAEIQLVFGNDDNSCSLVLNLNFFGKKLINFLLYLWNNGLVKYIGIKISIATPSGFRPSSVYMIEIDKNGFEISQEDTDFKAILNNEDLYNSILQNFESTDYVERERENELADVEFQEQVEKITSDINAELIIMGLPILSI